MSSRRRPCVALLVLVALASGLLGLAAGVAPASAHAQLVSISPVDGAQVSTAPSEVVLAFDKAPTPGLSVARVTGPGGSSVTRGAPEADGANVRQALAQDLAPGSYTVAWKAVSDDGHPVSGTSAFVHFLASQRSSATSASMSPTDGVVLPAPSANGSTTPVAGSTGSSAGTGSGQGGAFWIIALAALVLGGLAWVRALRQRHPTHGADD